MTTDDRRLRLDSVMSDYSEIDYQEILKLQGVVVVPTPLADSTIRSEIVQRFLQTLRESPEFKDPNPDDPAWKPQLGGFAAMANPSSFHHPLIRQLREMMTAALLDLDVLPLEGRKLEQTFDRMLYRVAGEKPTAESMHRDESPKALQGDSVFGGWVNLDDAEQYFLCAPTTHREEGIEGKNSGFALIKSKEEQEKYRQIFRTVKIPPGYCVVFYERLVHEVRAIKAEQRMLRMFLGWRITDADEPLFGTEATLRWMREQAVPKIKSGQDPPVWPGAYSNFSRNFQTLTDWSLRTFDERCLFTATVASGEFTGRQFVRVKAKMLSLQEYGLDMWPAYDSEEVKLMLPQGAWQLRTFDSPQDRVRYLAVSAQEWRAYVAAQHAVPLGATVRRPRPERVSADA